MPALRVCAVSYLNTVPLVWGMVHGPQRGIFDLSFALPSECADRLASGAADIGLVPAVEAPRLRLEVIPGNGIACRGAVRSILLFSKVPWNAVRTLACDSGSRSSAQLARIILEQRYGVVVESIRRPPVLPAMLDSADAALIIGDPALALTPAELPYRTLDLGAEWSGLTGLPMVFAVWAGRTGVVTPELPAVFRASWRYGMERLDDIVAAEAPARRLPAGLVREYLSRRIVFELGEPEYAGMRHFLRLAGASATLETTGGTLSR